MNVYKVSRLGKIGRGTYNAFICIAADDTAARHMPPNASICWSAKHDKFISEYEKDSPDDEIYGARSWPEHPSRLHVETICPIETTTPIILLASFNAG